MFDQMRKNTKTILWVTVIAFVGLIFLAWGADFQLGGKKNYDPSVVGMVNGTPIQSQTYEQLVAQNRQQYQAQTGREPDERTEVMIRQQVWDQMVQDILLRQEVNRRGIQVTDQEIVEAIMTQPPPEVQQNPAFQTNGQFDLSKYQQALRNPNVDTRGLEQQYRSNLPIQKLQMQVAGTVSVSDDDLWNTWQAQNEKVKVSYIMLPAGQFPVEEGNVTDDQLQSYYQGHRESYRLPAQAVLQYIQIPRAYTVQDSLDLIEQGRQVLSELKDGEDFQVLVDAYTEAPPSMRGGDTAAWLTANQIPDPAVREAAFSLPVGQVSDIIATAQGVHVIKVLERRKDATAGEQVKLADIMLPLRPSPETLSTLRDKVYQFRTDVDERPFDQVAAEMDLSVKETTPFSEQGFIPGLGSVPELTRFAFSRPIGSVSVPVEKADGWVVARLKERQEAHVPALAEVADRVRTEVVDSLRVDAAVAAAQPLLDKVRNGAPLKQVASSDRRATFDTTDPFARLGFPKGIGADPRVIGPIFAADVGLIPHVLRGRAGAFVVQVDEKIAADRAPFEAQLAQQRLSVIQRRQGQVMNGWLEDLRKTAEIEDFRYGHFNNG